MRLFFARRIPQGRRAPASVPGDLPSWTVVEKPESTRRVLLIPLTSRPAETSTPRGRDGSNSLEAGAIAPYVM